MFWEINFKDFEFVKPSYIFSAANSVDFKKGILNSFLSVKGVLIKPGEITEIFTLYFFEIKIDTFSKIC